MVKLIADIFNENMFLATLFVSMLPIIEARGAIPFAMSNELCKNALSPVVAFIASFLGSSIMVILLLIIIYPLCEWLKNIKLVKSFINKLNGKTQKISNKSNISKMPNYKKYAFLTLFTLLPIPLTGYYSACLLASFLKLSKLKSFFAICVGNLICILIMTLISIFAYDFTTLIFYFFLIVFLLTIIYFIIDSIYLKNKPENEIANCNTDNN